MQKPSGREPAEEARISLRSSSRRRSVAITLIASAVLVLTGGALFVAGAFEGDGAPVAADPTVTSASSAAQTPEEIPGETIGTSENPFGPGDTFTFFDDWTFTFGATNPDTWPGLASYYEEHFPDKISQYEPEPGMVYVTVPVSMTYTGTEAKREHILMALNHVSAAGTETGNTDCGLTGRNYKRFESVTAKWSSELEGSLCAEIRPEDVPGGQWWIYLSYYDPATGTERNQQFFYTAE
jgi:hypothetical protein